jgi:hypothetical protein
MDWEAYKGPRLTGTPLEVNPSAYAMEMVINICP